MRAALDALVKELGWPAVVEVSPFARSRRFENWQVELEDGTRRLLRVTRAPAGHRGLQHEAAARVLLEGSVVPHVVRYHLVPDDRFGASAAISSWIDGEAGTGVLDAHPGTLADLCALCGQLAKTLEATTTGGFGMTVVDGRFQPIRATWDEEYLAAVHDWASRAEAVGASLGPLGGLMLARLEALRPSLREARSFCLVHGDLGPSNLILEVGQPPEKDQPPPVSVVGLVDWEYAARADPLLALANALELPDEGLAHFVDGWGAEDVARLVEDPAALDRLEAYAIGRVFQYLALGVAAQIEGGGAIWGYGMAYALRLGRERGLPGFAAARLEAVLALEALPAEVPLPDYVEPVPAALRRALGRLICRPVPGPRAAGPWMGAVAAALRDVEHPDEGWVKDAHLALDALGPELELRGFEPLGARGAWMAAMDDRVRALAGDDGPALGVWWFAVEALVHLASDRDPRNWPVQDGLFRGLQGFLEALGAEGEPADAREALLRALVAVVADHRLEVLSGRPADRALRAARRARLLERWEDLVVFGDGAPAEGEGTDALRPAAERGDAGWRVPVVLFAIEFAPPDLPVPRDRVASVVCG